MRRVCKNIGFFLKKHYYRFYTKRFGQLKTKQKEISLNDWIEVCDNNDLAHLYKAGRLKKWLKCVLFSRLLKSMMLEENERLLYCYDTIEQEYFDKYGTPDSIKKIFDKKINLLKLITQYIRTKQRSLLILIRVLEDEINQDLDEAKKTKKTFGEFIGKVEKEFSFSFNRDVDTLAQFYDRTA